MATSDGDSIHSDSGFPETGESDEDAADSQAAPAFSPGDRIGHFIILERLGKGGMGEVFLANDSRLHRKVALKVLLASTSTDDNVRDTVLREARAVAKITHPNVAAVYDVIELDSRSLIVMEYVEGENLAARLIRERLPVQTVVALDVSLLEHLRPPMRRGSFTVI